MIVDQNSLTLKPGLAGIGTPPSTMGKGAAGNLSGGPKSELQRYKEALAAMEKQWEEATKALNEHTLHAQLQDAMTKLTAANNEVIKLKKENQLIRLESNLVNPADAAA